jgi:hypothetical protein
MGLVVEAMDLVMTAGAAAAETGRALAAWVEAVVRALDSAEVAREGAARAATPVVHLEATKVARRVRAA